MNTTPRPASGRNELHQRVGVILALLIGLLACHLIGPRSAGAYPGEVPFAQAYANAPGWITVVWTHSGDADAYTIEHGAPGIPPTPVGAGGTQTFTNLAPDTVYRLRVCADEACSPWLSVRTPVAPVPGGTEIPHFVRQTPSIDRITVRWESSESYGFYQVRWAENNHPDGQVKLAGGRNGAFTARGLRAGTGYHFIVQGCHTTLFGSSCSHFSAPVFVTTLVPSPPVIVPPAQPAAPLPPKPANLYVKALTSDYLELAWTPNITDLPTTVEYDIYRDGVRVKTQTAYPIVENHFFDTLSPALPPYIVYKVCAVDRRGTPTQAQQCSDSLRIRNAPDLTLVRVVKEENGGHTAAAVAVYQVAINNLGHAPGAPVTVVIQGGGMLEAVAALPSEGPDAARNFTCTGTGAITCTGPLGGSGSAVQELVAVFRVEVRARATGVGSVSATVDPQNRVTETEEGNNTQTLTVTVR